MTPDRARQMGTRILRRACLTFLSARSAEQRLIAAESLAASITTYVVAHGVTEEEAAAA